MNIAPGDWWCLLIGVVWGVRCEVWGVCVCACVCGGGGVNNYVIKKLLKLVKTRDTFFLGIVHPGDENRYLYC